jgi:YidC/Oxa1 family membrane protein insertase
VSSERRLIVTIALCLAIYVGWAALMAKFHPRPIAPPPAPTAEKLAAPGMPLPTGTTTPATPAAPPKVPEQLVELDDPAVHVVLSSYGGTLAHATLKNPRYQRTVDGKTVPVDLVRGGEGYTRPLATRFGGALAAANPLADFEVERDPDGRGVRFRRAEGPFKIEKRYALVREHQLELTVSVTGGNPESIELDYPGNQPPATVPQGGFFGRIIHPYPNLTTAICRVDGSSHRSASGKAEEVTLPEGGKVGLVQYTGLDERFFVAAVMPRGDRQGRCVLRGAASGELEASLELPFLGEVGASRRFGVYLGPKDLDLLTANSRAPDGSDDSELQSAIDFGFWTVLCVPMLRALEFFDRWVRNWGIAIILLTLLIKILTLPIQNRQFRAMEAMKKLQPLVEQLKKKYPDDKERLNVETMKLYTEHKANPFGGCLLQLLQLPIWWALYRLLGTTIQLYRAPFIPGWINDLTAPDPYFILPVAMGVTMVITQLLNPQMAAQAGQQKLMMWFMPVFFSFLMLQLPSGLILYIFASNLLSIGQQYWISRRSRAASEPAVAK